MNEFWRPVLGYEGLYEVSSEGRVKSVARVIRRSNGTLLPVNERLLAAALLRTGHPIVNLWRNNKGRTWAVHRLVALAFIPKVGDEVRHYDGDASRSTVENLVWGTHSDNMGDMARHGRSNRGVKNHFASLDEAKVRAIRAKKKSGMNQSEIGREFGVGPDTISHIVRRNTWRHVA